MARSANFHSTELFVLCRRLEDRTRAHHKTCEQLAQGYYLKAQRPGVEPATFGVASPTP